MVSHSCFGLTKRGSPVSFRPNRSPLGKTPHKAGVKRDGRMTAPGTVIEMTAQSWRAAALNGTQYFQLLIAEPGAVLHNEAITVRAK